METIKHIEVFEDKVAIELIILKENCYLRKGNNQMFGHIGFSYTGLLFLLMLTIPNLIWTKRQPKGYSAENENKILLCFERIGQVLTSGCVLIFSDFNLQQWSAWSLWLVAALMLMILYEFWWMRYFSSKRELSDFYSSLLGIPVAGATLPVIAFFLLGIYGRVIWLLIAVVILGVGHIGIHLQHRKENMRTNMHR